MQKLFYDQAPNLILVYPYGLQVYDTTRWQGWTKVPAVSGSVLDRYGFMSISPTGATAAKSNTGLVTAAVVGVIVLVAAVVAVLLVLRRRSARQVEVA